MASRKLNEMPGIFPGQPAVSGGVQKIDCGNVATIENCLDPIAAQEPLTLNYYNVNTIPILNFIPLEWRQQQLTTAGAPHTLLPNLNTNASIDLFVDASGYIGMTNNTGQNDSVTWLIKGYIARTMKNVALPSTAWLDTNTIYFTEDGMNTTDNFRLVIVGDSLEIVALTGGGNAERHLSIRITRFAFDYVTDVWYNEVPT